MGLAPLMFSALAVPAVLAPLPASAYEMPYDPYPWRAVYGGDAGGASNCGFLSIEQCRATVSGIGDPVSPISSTIRGRLRAQKSAALGRRSRFFEKPSIQAPTPED